MVICFVKEQRCFEFSMQLKLCKTNQPSHLKPETQINQQIQQETQQSKKVKTLILLFKSARSVCNTKINLPSSSFEIIIFSDF